MHLRNPRRNPSYTLNRPAQWPDDLIIDELPSLGDILENPEWWREISTDSSGRPRDIYLRSARD